MKRLLLLLATLSMLCMSLIVPAVASAATVCIDGPYPQGVFVGNEHGSTSLDVYGVTSYIDMDTIDLKPCTYNPGNDGASAWVSLTPAPGTSQHGNTDAIIQIGVIRCNSPLEVNCSPGTHKLFWAAAGCNASKPVAVVSTTTVSFASTGHTFTILKYANDDYKLFMDGTQYFNTIHASDWTVNCWAGDRTEADWYAEAADGGDQITNDNTFNGQIDFDNSRYKGSATGAWFTPNVADPCDSIEPTNSEHSYGCNVDNNNHQHWAVWSTAQH